MEKENNYKNINFINYLCIIVIRLNVLFIVKKLLIILYKFTILKLIFCENTLFLELLFFNCNKTKKLISINCN